MADEIVDEIVQLTSQALEDIVTEVARDLQVDTSLIGSQEPPPLLISPVKETISVIPSADEPSSSDKPEKPDPVTTIDEVDSDGEPIAVLEEGEIVADTENDVRTKEFEPLPPSVSTVSVAPRQTSGKNLALLMQV